MIQMTEEKKKLHGFAGIVAKQIEPLNEMEEFKQKFKDTEVKVLLNAKDGKWAALLIINKGKIYVEGIKNNPKENIKKENAGWDGLLSCKTNIFLELLGGDNVSTGKVIRKILTGKIKIRGIKNVLVLLQLFDL
ncbi:unnamed protein product [marine sediment metagenome]|uniref:SCP2 domain-containing protein n=1 Tax=marine sediment metagenome TaxID=412755 RepID=X1MSB5_9ZZZZ